MGSSSTRFREVERDEQADSAPNPERIHPDAQDVQIASRGINAPEKKRLRSEKRKKRKKEKAEVESEDIFANLNENLIAKAQRSLQNTDTRTG